MAELPVLERTAASEAQSTRLSSSPSQLLQPELRLRFSGNDPYDFAHWYPLLSRIKTIPATIIAVDYDTALALKRVCEDHQDRQHLLRFCGNDLSKLPQSPPPTPRTPRVVLKN